MRKRRSMVIVKKITNKVRQFLIAIKQMKREQMMNGLWNLLRRIKLWTKESSEVENETSDSTEDYIQEEEGNTIRQETRPKRTWIQGNQDIGKAAANFYKQLFIANIDMSIMDHIPNMLNDVIIKSNDKPTHQEVRDVVFDINPNTTGPDGWPENGVSIGHWDALSSLEERK
ncbi:hypothetical protein HAX54_051204 [Datura stramonium]|uniref:Uncharacterized protein n=1 Tax=Datura stramonium TaxID=4076 RepID=A0ABS8SXY4_DATST|nr:hypothetical protein [Datura stramonium]